MNSQKQNRHSLMAKGIMVLLSLLILVFILTFAWFTDSRAPVVANGLSAKSEINADFEIAIGFKTPETGTYKVSSFVNTTGGNIDFEHINVPATLSLDNNTTITNGSTSASYNLLADFNPIDLTGNGVVLYRPEMEYMNRKIKYTAPAVSKDITGNVQYITFDLYVRSTKPDFTISLDDGSYVVAAAEVSDDEDIADLVEKIANPPSGFEPPNAGQMDPSELKGASVTRKSEKYGDFSEDSVVGATRIAFTQYNVTSSNLSNFFSDTLTLDANKSRLWIPRSDIYLQDVSGDVSSNNKWVLHTKNDNDWNSAHPAFNADADFGTAVSDGGTITYKGAASEHWYYDELKLNNPQNSSRYTPVDNVLTDISAAADNDKIIINSAYYNNTPIYDGTYYYGKCRINLWVEGCDAEARKAIDGGSFFFGFDLTVK